MKRILMLALLLAACKEEATTQSSYKKVVKDQIDREVVFNKPVERVISGQILPYFSTWFVATNSTKEIVAMHPNSYNAAQNSMLAKISPDILKAQTNFIANGQVNIEAVLNLKPDVYFEIASDTKSIDKMAEAGINVLALKTANHYNADPVAIFESWLKLTGEIANKNERVDNFHSVVEQTRALINDKINNLTNEQKPKVMVLHKHSDKSIVVAGNNFFSQQWIEQSGGVNVASELTGMKEVNIEQIYNWNPDIIYITNFTETLADDLINNEVEGQDWSNIKAVQDKKVYKIPLGIYRWFPPNGDAPLMLKWLAKNNHPDLFDYKIEDEIKDYYQKSYHYNLTDAEVASILNPPREAARY